MRSTITFKLLLALIAVFSCVLAASTAYQYHQQKTLINDVLSEQLHDKASNYFDSLNMMMLTGTMSQKETLRQKALAQEGIEAVRVLRADAVTKLYGPGQQNQQPVDDIDKRALNGELVIEPISADWGQRVSSRATNEIERKLPWHQLRFLPRCTSRRSVGRDSLGIQHESCQFNDQ